MNPADVWSEMRFILLISRATPPRGRDLIKALHRGAESQKVESKLVSQYQADPEATLMLYGLGGPDRLPVAKEHLKSGGRLVAWDSGYWDRKLNAQDRKFRVSIDGFHPPQFIMSGSNPGPERMEKSAIKFEAGGNPSGPILLVGNAPKSIAVGAAGWTAEKAREIRAAFPGKKIVYRPKPKRPAEKGIDYDVLSSGPIEAALDDCSLVVCRHSNVAVDACLRGVPVVCDDDGAAAAIYPSALNNADQQPDEQTRAEFVHRLAWWQWSPNECAKGLVWPWLIGVLNAGV